MKFTANSIELQRTLNKVGGVVPAKSTMPILENILCELSGNILTLTATDLAISLTVSLQVRGSEDGTIAIPARRLMDTMRSLPDTGATFVADVASSKIRITTDNGEYSLTGESAREFPSAAAFKGSSEIALDAGTLRGIIHRTTFAVSTDELRPAMMGVLFQAKENELRAVSTDGHRLVKLILRQEKPLAMKRDVVIPAKALQVLGKSIDEGETTISMSDTHAKFTFGQSVLITRLIDEAYPNYESVIPADNDREMTVKRDDMISSIRRVALYASATTHQVRFDIGKSSLQVTAQDIDFGGEARETVPCTFSGDRLEIGFNSVYLTDILTHLESEQVAFLFSTPTRAGIVSPVGEDSDRIMMLVMPVRLNT
ncbi:MAG TPA: DNA polymerase III subunit beta [Bacteroidota bacterium]|nr:DNA polymerase III subunit beta [Bacteroidota bacterium]